MAMMDDRSARTFVSARERHVRSLLGDGFKDVPYVRASSRAASTAADHFSDTEFGVKSVGEASRRRSSKLTAKWMR
jgi:hypothetical protein